MQVRPAALAIERHAARPSSDAGAARGHAEQAVERLLATRCWHAAYLELRKQVWISGADNCSLMLCS
jgi:hypothetical protein